MKSLALAALLLAGCRGEREPEAVPQGSGSGTAVTAPAAPPSPAVDIPKLAMSPDGVETLHGLDVELEAARAANNEVQLVNLLMSRAAIAQRLEDYVDALDHTKALV